MSLFPNPYPPRPLPATGRAFPASSPFTGLTVPLAVPRPNTAPRFISLTGQIPTDADPDPATSLLPFVAAGIATIKAQAKAVAIATLARKLTILSGNVVADSAFYAAYLRDARVEALLHEGTRLLTRLELPESSPVKQSSLSQRFTLGFPSQKELDELFRRGRFGDLMQSLELARQLRLQATGPPGRRPGPGVPFSIDPAASQQRLESLELGLEARFTAEAIAEANNRAAAKATGLFVQALTDAGVFGGTGDIGPLPGERGDP